MCPGMMTPETITAEMQPMPMNFSLRCRCGHVSGVASEISPSSGLRIVCYCKDCQEFVLFLGRTDVLDPTGRTDIF